MPSALSSGCRREVSPRPFKRRARLTCRCKTQRLSVSTGTSVQAREHGRALAVQHAHSASTDCTDTREYARQRARARAFAHENMAVAVCMHPCCRRTRGSIPSLLRCLDVCGLESILENMIVCGATCCPAPRASVLLQARRQCAEQDALGTSCRYPLMCLLR